MSTLAPLSESERAVIARTVDQAPPLSTAQKVKLAALVRPTAAGAR